MHPRFIVAEGHKWDRRARMGCAEKYGWLVQQLHGTNMGLRWHVATRRRAGCSFWSLGCEVPRSRQLYQSTAVLIATVLYVSSVRAAPGGRARPAARRAEALRVDRGHFQTIARTKSTIPELLHLRPVGHV
eukprot:890194-Prymnesium_polylepis.1